MNQLKRPYQPLEGELCSNLSLSSGSPFDQIPPDLLYLLFNLARHDSPFSAPFTLSHVCSKWRSFLLDSPSLWTILVIKNSPIVHPNYHDLWLHRSQNMDLSIRTERSDGVLHYGMREFSDRFIASRPRWKEIELDSACRHYIFYSKVITWLQTTDFPKLTKLRIDYSANDTLLLPSMATFTPMPNLESLDVQASIFTPSPAWISACRRLRLLRITFGYLGYMSNILPHLYDVIHQISDRLEVLCISLSYSLTSYPQRLGLPRSSKTPISLPNLTKLELSLYHSEKKRLDHSFHPLLPLLYAPNLREADTMHVAALEYLAVHNSFPALHQLSLTGYHHEDELGSRDVAAADFTAEPIPAFRKVFAQLSQLCSVSFEKISWHGGEYATSLQTSCPQLVSLSLDRCWGVNEPDLFRLVQARMSSENITSLQYLKITNCPGLKITSEEDAWFTELLESFDYDGLARH